uniref:Putative secreted peptide n=1 Tax=Anopheles braziliensis TaxID=58242 RepID=A0A2M3ZRM5_9DIPT
MVQGCRLHIRALRWCSMVWLPHEVCRAGMERSSTSTGSSLGYRFRFFQRDIAYGNHWWVGGQGYDCWASRWHYPYHRHSGYATDKQR